MLFDGNGNPHSELAAALIARRQPDNQRREFGALEVALVWSKAKEIPGQDPLSWRADDYGNYLFRSDRGKSDSPYGWDVDHIVPLALGGTNEIANLRPLRCSKNRSLGGLLASFLNPDRSK